MYILWEVANSFGLEMSTSINPISTQYINNFQDLNSVLGLMFFWAGLVKFNKHDILPDLQSLLDHAPLLVSIIEKEFI